jgi:hypothetical protein
MVRIWLETHMARKVAMTEAEVRKLRRDEGQIAYEVL